MGAALRDAVQHGGFFSSNRDISFTREVENCLRFAFDVDVIGRNTEDFGDLRLHLRKIRQQLVALSEDVRIDVADFISFLPNEIGRTPQEFETRNPLVSIIGIRKHLTDIAETTGAKQGIGDGVTKDIAIGMSDETFFMGDLHPPQDQGRRWTQPMQIVTNTNSKFHCRAFASALSSSRKARARLRSEGRVILLFRSEPRTIATGCPSLSTRLDSSVP